MLPKELQVLPEHVATLSCRARIVSMVLAHIRSKRSAYTMGERMPRPGPGLGPAIAGMTNESAKSHRAIRKKT